MHARPADAQGLLHWALAFRCKEDWRFTLCKVLLHVVVCLHDGTAYQQERVPLILRSRAQHHLGSGLTCDGSLGLPNRHQDDGE